jgi:hypothetical protein
MLFIALVLQNTLRKASAATLLPFDKLRINTEMNSVQSQLRVTAIRTVKFTKV